MPLHDWTCVDAGIFHDLHIAWFAELQKAFNGGLLPEGYYALIEQHTGRAIEDLLTLHASTHGRDRPGRCTAPHAAPAHGGTDGAGPPPLAGHPPRQRPPPGRPHRDHLASKQGPLSPRRGVR